MQKMLGDPEFRNIIKKDGNILEIFRQAKKNKEYKDFPYGKNNTKYKYKYENAKVDDNCEVIIDQQKNGTKVEK